MIYDTPDQTKGLLDLVRGSDNPRDWPIRKHYPGHESTFLMFHPFLKIKEKHTKYIKFETGNWPTKFEIIEHCDQIPWRKILEEFEISDIKALDRALAFYHCATKHNDPEAYDKLNVALENSDLIPPQVDVFPEILENEVLNYLKNKGEPSVYVYTDIDEKSGLTFIKDLLSKEGLPYQGRLEAVNGTFQIITDFDQRFSYINGTRKFVSELVEKLDLEGFYCDENTIEAWSLEPERNKKMDWPSINN